MQDYSHNPSDNVRGGFRAKIAPSVRRIWSTEGSIFSFIGRMRDGFEQLNDSRTRSEALLGPCSASMFDESFQPQTAKRMGCIE